MANMNATRAVYFDCNPNSKSLFFTDDDVAFYRADQAQNHAQNLQIKSVDEVTREEYDAWVKANAQETTAPAAPVLTPLEQAQTNLATAQGVAVITGDALAAAQKALEDATAAKANLTPDATKQDKTNATKAVTAATKAVADAQAAKDNADLDVQTATDALEALTTGS